MTAHLAAFVARAAPRALDGFGCARAESRDGQVRAIRDRATALGGAGRLEAALLQRDAEGNVASLMGPAIAL